jgi:hypothetical protein
MEGRVLKMEIGAALLLVDVCRRDRVDELGHRKTGVTLAIPTRFGHQVPALARAGISA